MATVCRGEGRQGLRGGIGLLMGWPAWDGGVAPMTRSRFHVGQGGDPRFRGCVSRSGVRRYECVFDKDGKCLFCDCKRRKRRRRKRT